MGHHGGVQQDDPTRPISGDAADDELDADVDTVDELEPVRPDRGSGGHGGDERVARQNRLAGLGAILLVVVLAFGSGIAVGRATAPSGTGGVAAATASPAAPGASGSPATSAGPTSVLESLPSDGPLLGSKDAKLTITYWADYQCPFCEKFATEILPLLASRIADGSVSVLHRDFAFIGPESIGAAVAVRCGGEQGRYWPMHDAVYAAQSGENQGAFSADRLAQIAASIGLDPAKFASCVTRHDLEVAVLDDTAAGVRAGVTSTPTIDVGGQRFLGVTDTKAFLAAVDAAVAAGATPGPSPSTSPSGDPWSGTRTSGREAGSATAPVTVELWSDYQSSDMATVAKDLEPELRKRIAEGRIRVVGRDLALLGSESVTAASMVRCAAQQSGPAWFVSDILAVSGNGAQQGIFTTENLLRLGARLGLDVRALDTCLADPAIADAVTSETAAGTALGLKVAPSVVVKVGDREVARFSGALDAAKVLAAIDAAK
jgi:protein-disulfide isomerase